MRTISNYSPEFRYYTNDGMEYLFYYMPSTPDNLFILFYFIFKLFKVDKLTYILHIWR